MDAQHQLKDVEVERVDAVDAPATRRKWLLLKSEEEDEEVVNADELSRIVRSLLDALAKEEEGSLPLSDDAIAALNALANAVGAEVTFTCRRKQMDEVHPVHDTKHGKDQEEYGYGYPPPDGRRRKSESEPAESASGGQLAEVLEAILTELREQRSMLENRAVAKSVGASKQPVGDPRPGTISRRWGEGLFADVLFGDE